MSKITSLNNAVETWVDVPAPKRAKIQTMISVLAVCILIGYAVSFYSMFKMAGNARVVNYAGIMRGATQKLVKEELNGMQNDKLRMRLDSIVFELTNGSCDKCWQNLSKIDDEIFQDDMTKINVHWSKLKKEILEVRSNVPNAKDTLFASSELYFDKCNKAVFSVEAYSNRAVAFMRNIISILIFLDLSALFFLFFFTSKEQKMQKERENLLIKYRDLNVQSETDKRVSKEKTDFLARMSHEMRTPLNAIIGFSEISLAQRDIPKDTLDSISKIYEAGNTLLSIVNDVLDVSKIESGKFELIPIDYDTPSLVSNAINLNIMRIESKPVQFVLDIDKDLPSRLFGDELRIRQIFSNLLSNAFKYTREGIVNWHIGFERHGDEVWLVSTVKDTGIGIKNEDLGNLFGEYNQVNMAANRKIEGTGLGLAITKKMIEMMGGEIQVESVFGVGSKFTLRLKQKLMSETPIGEECANSLKNFKYSFEQKKQTKRLVYTQMPYAHILIVDDMPMNLDVAKGLLQPYNMHIDTAKSGQEAIDKIKMQKVIYDAVFMDHMMPEMDGIEATKIIRKLDGEYAKNVPIIALTANALTGIDQMFFDNGFNEFLSKPMDIMKMDTILKKFVRRKSEE